MRDTRDRDKAHRFLTNPSFWVAISAVLGLVDRSSWAGAPAAQGPVRAEYVSLDNACLYAKGLRHRPLTRGSAGLQGEMYLDGFTRKLQRSGPLFQPQARDGHSLGGQVTLEIVLRTNGKLCGYRPLTPAAAPAVVEAAGKHLEFGTPFAPLPPSVSDNADVVHIGQSWSYQGHHGPGTPRHRLRLQGSGSENGVRGTARYEVAVPLR